MTKNHTVPKAHSADKMRLLLVILFWLSCGTAALAKLPKSTPKIPVETDFDVIKKYDSYDPVTGTWSRIEAFEGVELLEDETETREDQYIHRGFWAYDSQEDKWHKVDIQAYRRSANKSTTEHTEGNEGEDDEEDKEQPKKDSLWKHLVLSLGAGGGGTVHFNKFTKGENTSLELRRRDKDLFMCVGAMRYKLLWPKRRPEQMISTGAGGSILNEKVVPDADGVTFRGVGGCIPVTLALHYTFFDRLRIGGGGNLIINYLPKLSPLENAQILGDFTLRSNPFYHLGWFGLVGFKVWRTAPHAVIFDVRIGQSYDFGATPLGERLYDGWHYNIGLGYERKVHGYFKLMTRLAFDWQSFSEKLDTPKAVMTMQQPAIHLQLGINLNFGRDTEGDSAEEDEGGFEKIEEVATEASKKAEEVEKTTKRIEQGVNRVKKQRDKLRRVFKSNLLPL